MKRPATPKRPEKPLTHIKRHVDDTVSSGESLQACINMVHDGVSLEYVYLDADVADSEYSNCSYAEMRIEYDIIEENKNYATQLKRYEEKLKQYNLDLEVYNQQIKVYNTKQRLVNKEAKIQQIKKLEKQLLKLKKENSNGNT